MENLRIEGKDLVPTILFDADAAQLRIEGESCHEYTHEFFAPVFAWVDDFLIQNNKPVSLSFAMTYFNTASSKCMYEIVEKLAAHHEASGVAVEINWHYEESDHDMLEVGQDYMEDSGFPINLVPRSGLADTE